MNRVKMRRTREKEYKTRENIKRKMKMKKKGGEGIENVEEVK